MDPLSLTASLIAILSCAFTITTLSRDWGRRTEFAKEVFDVHRREVEVLEHVLDECKDSIARTAEVPPSIMEAFLMCQQRQVDLQQVMSVARQDPEGGFALWYSWVSVNIKLPLLEKDLKRRYGMFKEDVVLLRALCSELRSQHQLVEMSAGIGRLVSDYIIDVDGGEDNSSDARSDRGRGDHTSPRPRSELPAPSSEDIGRNKGSPLPRRAVLNTLSQLGQSNYVVRAIVAIERTHHTGGNRFEFVAANSALPVSDPEHVPALVKLDTGSDVDIVSQEFLDDAGVNSDLFEAIPDEQIESFVTIGGKQYHPQSRIRLLWYMEQEQRFRRNLFYVVAGAPVDLLLGSKQFAQEAAKRVALFSRAPKSTTAREAEQRNLEQRKKEAREEEERIIEEDIRRRLAKRAQTNASSTGGALDVELGRSITTTSARQGVVEPIGFNRV